MPASGTARATTVERMKRILALLIVSSFARG
jgi:hypothetical protein